ncbi:MAG: flavin reductase [Clostridia bacterium]|nr:flavin reductase [Clostridia bacterium]
MSLTDKKALNTLTYGLFVLTAKEGEKDNGCIINTAQMLTSDPTRVAIFVNKANYTNGMIERTGVFNISVLEAGTPFALFKHFGFASGKDVDKFDGRIYPRSENGLYYIYENSNAYLSCKVVGSHDYGTHTIFIGEVTDGKTLSDKKSISYEQYLTEVKPQRKSAPQNKAEKPNDGEAQPKEKWVCKVCGYVHEGPLPEDFICPWCKHPASDFERVS